MLPHLFKIDFLDEINYSKEVVKAFLRMGFEKIDQKGIHVILKGEINGIKITLEEIKKWINDNCIYIDEKILENYLNKTALNLMLGDDEDGK